MTFPLDKKCGCGQRLADIRFRWSYTSDEYYCFACLAELTGPARNVPFVRFMPGCQDIESRNGGVWSETADLAEDLPVLMGATS